VVVPHWCNCYCSRQKLNEEWIGFGGLRKLANSIGCLWVTSRLDLRNLTRLKVQPEVDYNDFYSYPTHSKKKNIRKTS
jgi:hypothetical protein